jgi:futalosine hydrolase
MNLLIVAATQFEIEPFIQLKKKADILITGVGIPATIYHLTQKLLTENYDLVIQAGIAGSFSERLNLGEVVAIKEDTFADLGIEEKGNLQTLFETGFIKKNDFPFKNGWLVNQHRILQKDSLPLVNAITINKITDNDFQNEQMFKKFGADVESMEGAGFHYVCLHQKTNFLQLRSISNYIGERDKSKWEMTEAIENLNKELLKIVDNL